MGRITPPTGLEMADPTDSTIQPEQAPSTGSLLRLSWLCSLLVLVLGLLPWLDIRCEGKPSFTQNGYQIVLGQLSDSQAGFGEESLAFPRRTGKAPGLLAQEEGIPRAPLVGAFFLFIFSGFLAVPFVRPSRLALHALAFCHFLAVGALLNQMILGFPTEQLAAPISRSASSRATTLSPPPSSSPKAEVKYTLMLWIVLMSASFPPAVVVTGWMRPMVMRRLRPPPG